MQAAKDRAPVCENAMNALHRIPRISCGAKCESDVDSADHKHAVFDFDLAADIGSEPAVACVDLARLQRATKGSEHSAAGRGDDVVDRGGMGFREVLFVNSVVPRNFVVNAEYHGIRFAGQLRDSKRSLLSLNANVRDVDDLGIHAPYRIANF